MIKFVNQFVNTGGADEQLEQARELIRAVPARTLKSASVKSLMPELPLEQQIGYLLYCSEFLADGFRRSPDLLPELLRSDLNTPASSGRFGRTVKDMLSAASVDGDDPAESLMVELRHWRRLEMARIAWRDLLGLASTRETLLDLSNLADAAIKIADDYSFALCARRWGQPGIDEADFDEPANTTSDTIVLPEPGPQRLLTLAMGKLGGQELNFSSDIDLIFAYPQAGFTQPLANKTEKTKKADKALKKSKTVKKKGKKKKSHDGDPEPGISNEEFFHKQVQLFVRLLSKTTSDGFVFRVDLRLRPFGSTGPVALSFDALSHYYLTQGREWERYAMIKARAVTGSESARQHLQQILQPFIYRRYPDYTVFESLRDLKTRIASQLETGPIKDNIKTGHGGIREIEFIGQAFQLLHGGRDADLQQRSILIILDLLNDRQLLPADKVESLKSAYDFLRRLENRLQILRDEQTHSLPAQKQTNAGGRRRSHFASGGPARQQKSVRVDSGFNKAAGAKRSRGKSARPQLDKAATAAGFGDRQRIVHAMLFDDEAALLDQLQIHRDAVHRIFSDLFRVDQEGLSTAIIRTVEDIANYQQLLADSGIDQAQVLADAFDSYTSGATFQSLTEAAQLRVHTVLGRLPALALRASQSSPPRARAAARSLFAIAAGRDKNRGKKSARKALEESPAASHPAQTVQRLLALVRSVAGRSGYLQILLERPEALELLARLVARSRWVSDFIIAHPIVIDELLDQRTGVEPPLPLQVDGVARQLLEQLSKDDLDVQMDALRHLKLAQVMRAVAAGLSKQADVAAISELLTATAETSLRVVADLTVQELSIRHGLPRYKKGKQHKQADFAIVAYGKLGGAELGLGSDLDIIFLHDDHQENLQTDGKEPLDLGYYFARVARKIVHFVTTLTPAGVLYTIDTRLRPNGRSGMLVSSLDAFADYQHQRAWIWEHQALVRSRVVVGSEAFSRRFEAIREAVLAVPREDGELEKAIVSMRTKMAQHLDSTHSGAQAKSSAATSVSSAIPEFDYKQGHGGIVDIEFIVQYLVLKHCHNHRQLLGPRNHSQLLELAAMLPALGADDAATLNQAYLLWRLRLHEQALQNSSGWQDRDHDLTEASASSSADRQLREAVVTIWNRLLPAYREWDE